MSRPKIGLCYIINNLDAEIKATRKDVDSIKATFESIKFQVEDAKVNVSDSEMALLIRNLRRRDMSQYNCLFLFALSKGIPGLTVTAAGTTSTAFEVMEFAEALSLNPSLDGIPKLMFFESRVLSSTMGFSSEHPSHLGPDTFIGFSKTGFTSETNKHPSPFINLLAKTLRENYKKESFSRIFQLVQYRLTSSPINTGSSQHWLIKTPEIRSTLWKELFFSGQGKNPLLQKYI